MMRRAPVRGRRSKADPSVLRQCVLCLPHALRLSESLEELLQRAVRYCPQAETLWLMGAKEKWLAVRGPRDAMLWLTDPSCAPPTHPHPPRELSSAHCRTLPLIALRGRRRCRSMRARAQGDVEAARGILKEAFKSINSESIWLAAVKLESENGEYERARILLTKARENVGSERVWLKSAVLDRQLGRLDDARALLNTGREKFPTFAKLWMISGQIEEQTDGVARARELYNDGVRGLRCILWTLR